MKRSIIFVLLSILAISSCVSHKKYDRISKERDSLIIANSTNSDIISSYECYLDSLIESMDTIMKKENILHLNISPDGVKLNNKQLSEQINDFEQLVISQREKMRRLEEQIQGDNAEIERLTSVISFMQKQLDEKDEEIKRMKQELANKNKRIRMLNQTVTEMSDSIHGLYSRNQELGETVLNQQDALQVQDAMLNVGYYLVGTRKELNAMGITSALSSKLYFSESNMEWFTKVDIREFEELTVSGRIALQTTHPASSYTVEYNKDQKSSVLRISNASLFWSVSSFLIIQKK